MTEVLVDTRWDGVAGIQRYAREVLPRLETPWRPLGFSGDHLAPLDGLRKVPSVDLIYTPGYNAFARAKRQLVTLHDVIQLQAPWPGRAKYLAYYTAIVRPVVRRTGAVMTVSETSRQAITEWLRDDSVRVVNAGNGCSAAFHPDGPRAAGEPYLMYVGNLRTHKNVPVILDALVQVPDARLRMLLPAGEHEAARALLAARGIEQRVELLAGIDDEALAAQYRGAAATLMPSTLEGFGLPALESVMSGTPVLHWAGCAAVAEAAADRGVALDSATDAREWADAIRTALEKPQRVEPPTGFSWDATSRTVDAAIASLF
ncbi:MAG: glycosyltransferase family 1 protein [Microbacterium sp.]